MILIYSLTEESSVAQDKEKDTKAYFVKQTLTLFCFLYE